MMMPAAPTITMTKTSRSVQVATAVYRNRRANVLMTLGCGLRHRAESSRCRSGEHRLGLAA
ncbi:hypothetical protein A4G29_16915 [Mycobacterium kansasii]|nr:hypothetical protein A4G29_16915 [Mycobacterium kansasii]